MKIEEKIINIELVNNEKIIENKLFLENIEEVSKKLNINENILMLYMLYKGEFEDIIDGFKIIEISREVCKLKISKNITKKENINKNHLYNFANYCILNDFKIKYFKDKRYRNIMARYNYNEKKFDKNIKLYLNDNNTLLEIYFNKKYIVPENCSISLLEKEDVKLFNKLEKNLDEELDIMKNYYYTDIKINFTDNIEYNMKLIEKNIKKEYEIYIKKLNKIKEYNKKYFQKQILKNNIVEF